MRYLKKVTPLLLMLLMTTGLALTQSILVLQRQHIGGGGGEALADTISVYGALGQPIGGRISGGNVNICNGFWCGEPLVTTYYIYLPATLRSYINYFEGPWEVEPNDSAGQANGPIISDQIYQGTMSSPSDINDYFSFILSQSSTVEIILTDIPTGHDYDLTLRDSALERVGYSGETENQEEHISQSLNAGTYYIQIYNRSKTGSSEAYRLTANYD